MTAAGAPSARRRAASGTRTWRLGTVPWLLAAAWLVLSAAPLLALDAELRRKANSSNWKDRWDASSPLAKDGGPDAMRLFARLVGDEDARVRDHAIWAAKHVATDAGAAVLAPLAQQGPALRRRALVAALARTKRPVVFDALARAARSDSDARVRAEGAEAMEAFAADPRAVAVCADAAADAEPVVRASAVDAASRLEKDAGRSIVVAAWTDRDDGVRAAALGVMRWADAEASFPAAVADKSWRVRAQAAEKALEIRYPAAVDALVALVGDANDRVGGAAARALRLLSQKDFGRDADLWASWWTQNRAAWQPPKGDLKDPRTSDAPGATRARFMGAEVEGACTAFVLDFSGSMDEPVRPHAAEKRVDLVRNELETTLAALPDGHCVNVHLFSDGVRSFSRRSQALSANVRAAIRKFVRTEAPDGQTDLFAGLAEALADDAVDGIHVLSDGAPTRGEATSTLRITALLRRENRRRMAVVHAVGVGVEDADDRAFLATVAGENGGRAVFR